MFNLKHLLFFSVFISLFISCDKREVVNFKKNKNIPSRKIYNAKIIQKDSGEVKYQLTAPLIEEYGFLQTPVMLFRKGINISFYNKNNPKKGTLRADYAKVIDKRQWYEAKNNVVVITPEGDTMRTKSFFFNKKEHKIFTSDTVKISRFDKSIIYANNGLEAAEDFSWYKLYENRKSEVMIKD